MKKIILPFALTILTLCSNSNSTTPLYRSDPFIQDWFYFDGIATYKLHIAPSSAPGANYYINYTFPGGSAATDECWIKSNTSFNCATGETITRDDVNHLVNLTTRHEAYTFYDSNYMPATPFIFGKWHYQIKNQDITRDYVISITKTDKDSQYNVMSNSWDNKGNICSDGSPSVYSVTKNPDGSENVRLDDGPTVSYGFKFDPQKKEITNVDPQRFFTVGLCIFLGNNEKIVFTKEKQNYKNS